MRTSLLLLLMMAMSSSLAEEGGGGGEESREEGEEARGIFNWLSLALLEAHSKYTPTAGAASFNLGRAHYELLCNRLPGLNPAQRNICITHPFSIPFVSRGIRDAIYQCQQQFKFERWNCSDRYEISQTPNGPFHDILGKTLRTPSKESAYLAAVASAGIVHAVTKGCATGNLSDCGCDSKPALTRHQEMVEIHPPSASSSMSSPYHGGMGGGPYPMGAGGPSYSSMGGNSYNGYMPPAAMTHGHPAMSPPRPEPFSWGGCSDNVQYGVRYAKKFLDEWEKAEFERTKDVAHLVAMHNHFVGREAIATNVGRHCRCHGVSGSCEFKTCWLQMPKMEDVALLLKKRYDNFAVQVEGEVTKRARKRLRRKERSERGNPIRGNEMVYVTRSPTYCERNNTLGVIGTSGRACDKNSLNNDSCDLLCCGRGYNTRTERRITQCRCKFEWCCKVKCQECEEEAVIHTCK